MRAKKEIKQAQSPAPFKQGERVSVNGEGDFTVMASSRLTTKVLPNTGKSKFFPLTVKNTSLSRISE